ncbi:MAG TPA: GntR family transcriptional regulator [Propionibacteriaceae bacterium]|nr:GntR family transcriptional regulator [Propionibacteriaceae bacterium]
MIRRLSIDPTTSTAPFEQIRTQIAGMAANGILAPGAKLPTVRQLAAQLKVAPNTVARAYRELESDEVIVTDGRRGSFVASGAQLSSQTAGNLSAAADSYTAAARRAGLSLPEALRLIEHAWPTAPRPSRPSGGAGAPAGEG